MTLAMATVPVDQSSSTTENASQATELEDILVQGRRLDVRVRGFID
jgi:hypothetical protein